MRVGAQYAQEHFADIVRVASDGKEVQIALPDRPALFLAARAPAHAIAPRRPRAELLGAGEGMITLPTEEQWRAMGKQIGEEMLDGRILPPEHASDCCLIPMLTETLPRHHSDPFDRMIIAQAMEDDFTILSSDRGMPRYAVNVIWK